MDRVLQRPEWLKKRVRANENISATAEILRSLSLNTVCEGAQCPNIEECFSRKTATFMVLGNVCTRQCRFCAVAKGAPEAVNPDEPAKIGRASKDLGLKHVVVTSVTRDDLIDGGAEHFARTVYEINRQNASATVELLIPDLKGDWSALGIIIISKPEIINHNLETVPALYSEIRPGAVYEKSLDLLSKVKQSDTTIYTKSGIMVGLGERDADVLRVISDLREVDCDIITIGQYLRPSKQHVAVKEYIHPEKFAEYKNFAEKRGFKHVVAGPFVRSSYHAFVPA